MSDQETIIPKESGLQQVVRQIVAAGQETGKAEKSAAGQETGKAEKSAGGQETGSSGKNTYGQEVVNWYALRAFKRKVMGIKEGFEKMGFKTYMAMRRVTEAVDGRITHKDEQIIPQLLFVCCPVHELDDYKKQHDNAFMVYRHKVTDESGFTQLVPAPIPEREMKTFIFITSTGDGQDIEYFGDVMPHFEEGERVQVTEGIYKGATGFVKRIKRDRKLLVAIEGVAVVAISNIPMNYLRKI